MAKDFLFELGLEEMPAHAVTPAMNQLHDRMVSFLNDYHLAYDSIDMFSTPRRLAFRVNGLVEGQENRQEEAKGPSLKVAKDQDGNWTKAAIGFTRGQGLTVEDIYIKEFNGEEYIYVTKEIKGQKTINILPKMIEEVIEKMTFGTMMHWGSYTFEFIRPIRWMVSLYGEMLVPMQILDVKSEPISQGHRFLGKEVMITRPEAYEGLLRSQYVLVDPNMRKTMIMEQIIEFATKNQWKIDLDEDLLEEVNNLVEYPTAFVGVFDEKYLDIPTPVLTTSMKDHQRYFYVTAPSGKLLPYFVSVRNGNLENLEIVMDGNEKVLTARLEDAEFFYAEDQKQTISDYVKKLENVVFHEKIGTMTEKMARVSIICEYLADKLNATKEVKDTLARVASIYKFDLVTGMVGEFSELQGIMGEIYARLFGESEEVSVAIREHYLPISAEGELPQTLTGAILALADKLDSLMSFFSVDLIPSGSNDPYALRRQAFGIVRIIEEFGFNLNLKELQQSLPKLVNKESNFKYQFDEDLIMKFFNDRIRQLLQAKGIRHDIIEAVLKGEAASLEELLEIAQVLQKHRNDDDYKGATESFSRVLRLASKNAQDLEVNVELFENEAEKALHMAMTELMAKFAELKTEDKYLKLKELQPLINRYFDETMVMVDDEKVKNNRLAHLTKLSKMINRLANMDELIVK